MFSRRRSTRSSLAALSGLATLVALLALVAPAQAAAPASPSNLAPNGSTVNDIPVLSWDRGADATTYDVQVSANPAFSSTLWTQNGTWNDKATPTVQLPLGQVYWRVRAHNASGNSDWTTASFTHQAVSAPTLVAPGEGESLKQPGRTPVFQWSSVPGATAYVVRVGQDPDFVDSTRYITSSSLQATAAVFGGLLQPESTPYYWEVQAQLGAGYSTGWSAARSFTIQGLDAPQLQGPPDDINNAVQDVVLNWTAVAGAATYDLQVSTDVNFNTMLVNQTGITGTRFSPTTTLNNDQYYWRVRAEDVGHNTVDWSQTTTWHFMRNWPDQPTLQYPGNGDTVGDPFYYQWSGVPHASSYTVQLSTNSSFTNLVGTCSTVGTTMTPAQSYGGHSSTTACMPAALGTYYWRVQAVDAPKNVLSDVISAQVGKFTYSPATAVQADPADGAIVTVPTMSWEPVAGAEQYKVTYVDTTSGGSASAQTSALSYTPRSLLTPGHTYRWQVQTISDDGRVGSSLLAAGQPTFTVAAPSTPTASTPKPTDSPTSPRFPTLTWTPVSGATQYKVYVRTSGSGGYTQLSGTFAYPAGEDTGTTNLSPDSYDWIVEAYNGATLLSQTSDTDTGTFTITPLSPPANARVGLTGNAITGNAGTVQDTCNAMLPSSCQNLASTPVLSWQADPNAAYYELYISHDGEMTNLLDNYQPITVEGTMWADVAELPDSQAGSAYYWEAVPCTSTGVCSALQHAQLAFNKESDPAVLVSPVTSDPGNPVTVQNDVVLTWQDYISSEAAADPTGTPLTTPARLEAKQYRVQVSTTPDFSSVLETAVVDQTTFTSYATTYPEGPLYWRVQAIDGSGNNLNWSDPASFVKRSPSPTLTYPVSDPATPGVIPQVNGTNAFTWQPLPFAASYDIEVYKNDDTIGQTANRVLNATSDVVAYAPSNLLPASATPYTWRVRREDTKGRPGPWSAFQEFISTGASPTLTSPANGSPIAPNEALFSWLPSLGAAKYLFERRLAGSSSVAESVTTANSSWAEPALIGTGTWQWRVTALDASGNALGSPGSWTDMQFTVDGGVSASNDVSISGSGAVGTLLTLQAPTWNLTDVATTYQWQRGGSTISGQTGPSYTVALADVGKAITVKATGVRAGYTNGTSISNVVVGGAGNAPSPTVLPSATGGHKVGDLLTVNPGTWPGTPKYTYQWLRGGNPITGGTASTYRLGIADAAKQVSVRVTATITGYAPGTATSTPIKVAKMLSSTTFALGSSTIAKSKHSKLTVTVAVPNVAKPFGKIKIFDGKKLLATVKLKGKNTGHKTVKLPKLRVGKHKIYVKYLGNPSTKASKSKKATLKVTK